jgi:hypothetical protein
MLPDTRKEEPAEGDQNWECEFMATVATPSAQTSLNVIKEALEGIVAAKSRLDRIAEK